LRLNPGKRGVDATDTRESAVKGIVKAEEKKEKRRMASME
jgi:hypothetical protein